jgi:hypothetical protein
VPAKVVSEAALPWVTSAPRSTPLRVRLSLSGPLISEVAAPTTVALTIRPVLVKTVAPATVVLMPMEVATAGPKVPADTHATAAMMTSLATTSNQSVPWSMLAWLVDQPTAKSKPIASAWCRSGGSFRLMPTSSLWRMPCPLPDAVQGPLAKLMPLVMLRPDSSVL